MAIKLTIGVVDITATISAGYTHIKVYRSAEETSGFAEITTTASLIELSPGVSSYTYIDGNGTTEHWYRTTFYSTNTAAESAFSVSFHGNFVDVDFTITTYPEEAVFTENDRYVLDRIRGLIGDPKTLTRDYVSETTGYSSISEDRYTHTLSNPNGWPLKIVLDSTLYTSSEDPVVNGYQFITFSGTQIQTDTTTTSGSVLDIWYYHFRNSDTKILRTFNGLTPPPELTADQVTFELAAVCTAIMLLEEELRLFGVDSGAEVDIFQEIRIDPSGGFSSRLKDLDSLRKQKKDLIDVILRNNGGINRNLYGVLID